MVEIEAPAKAILLGEHAVVYGKPALAVAIDLPLRMRLLPAEGWRLDQEEFQPRRRGYIAAALERAWQGGPLAMTIRSSIPPASGLGSSAAVTCATLAGAMTLAARTWDSRALASSAFDVEWAVQGAASPTDTSTIAHGGGILLRPAGSESSPLIDGHRSPLWELSRGARAWEVSAIEVPRLSLVVGNTGVKGRTTDLVAAVRARTEQDAAARAAIERIGALTMEGTEALLRGDLATLGQLMAEDHALLRSLGVSHPALEALVSGAAPVSLGAKLTGAGGGGSIIALTDDVERTAHAIVKAGGMPYVVEVDRQGTRVVGEAP